MAFESAAQRNPAAIDAGHKEPHGFPVIGNVGMENSIAFNVVLGSQSESRHVKKGNLEGFDHPKVGVNVHEGEEVEQAPDHSRERMVDANSGSLKWSLTVDSGQQPG